MKSIVTTVLHDPEGILLPLIKEVEEEFKIVCSTGLVTAVSAGTSKAVTDLLVSLGVVKTDGEGWGQARINALKIAVLANADWIVSMDFDKLLHWLKVAPEEVIDYIRSSEDCDAVLGCRTNEAWKTYPVSWRDTEIPTNEVFSKATGIFADILTAQVKMNNTSAKVITENAKEAEWASCGEWPMILINHGLNVKTRFFDSLTWEDPDRFSLSIDELAKLYDSDKEWKKRYRNAEVITKVINELNDTARNYQ